MNFLDEYEVPEDRVENNEDEGGSRRRLQEDCVTPCRRPGSKYQ